MSVHTCRMRQWFGSWLCAAVLLSGGCFGSPKVGPGSHEAGDWPPGLDFGHAQPVPETQSYNGPLPHELEMTTLPEYVIEPPDVLRIAALRLTPKSPYVVEPLDALVISVNAGAETLNLPLAEYVIDPDGNIHLGQYGPFHIVDMKVDDVKALIESKLKEKPFEIKEPKASVSLSQSRRLQPIAGEFIVQSDGSVNLNNYGQVRVVGMSIVQARAAIESHLTKFVQRPEISLSVSAYNSKVFYVIYDGGGRGQTIVRMPITGNDKVLDAMAQLSGLPPVSSKENMWIARPSPSEAGMELIMPIDWIGIVTRGRTRTNYQLMPGDRLYVKANPFVAADNYIALVLAPFERLFGFSLLGNSAIQSFRYSPSTGTGGTSP